MPEDGFLLANAFESGRSMLFDLREPLHPSLVTSFGDLDGYMHPHTYVRLSNDHVLATFQYHGARTQVRWRRTGRVRRTRARHPQQQCDGPGGEQ